MTGKRFILTEQFVTLQGVTFVKDDNAYVDTYYTVGGAVDLLNDYAYENEQLKIDIGIIEDVHKLDREIIDDIHNEFQRVKKENEQLKADNNRLVNETAKIVAKHQKKVLELIDKKIAEYTEYYETQIEDQSYHEANAMKECVIALQELKRSF